jgi:hypothetical protein
MKIRNPYHDMRAVRIAIAKFIADNGMRYKDVANQIEDETGQVITHKEVWNIINQELASYEKIDLVASSMIHFGFEYEPLPSHDAVIRMIREYMTWRGWSKSAFLRRAKTMRLYTGAVDNFRQFNQPNHRILHRIVICLEAMEWLDSLEVAS